MSSLPTDSKARKAMPIFSGVLKYFPDAIAAVAHCSWRGTAQHHPDKPMHWERDKSSDHEDSLLRHLMGVGGVDTDNVRHSVKVAWRALAIAQLDLEQAAKEELSDLPPRAWEVWAQSEENRQLLEEWRRAEALEKLTNPPVISHVKTLDEMVEEAGQCKASPRIWATEPEDNRRQTMPGWWER